MTFRTFDSLSIKTIFCIFLLLQFSLSMQSRCCPVWHSLQPKTSNNQWHDFNLIIRSFFSSFVCKLLIFRYFFLDLASIFLSWGQATSHNHITLSSFFSNTKSGLLASLVFLTLYSKSRNHQYYYYHYYYYHNYHYNYYYHNYFSIHCYTMRPTAKV